MHWFEPISDWFRSHDAIVWWLVALSAGMFLLTPVAAAWYVTRLPKDAFARRRRRSDMPWWQRHPLLGPLIVIAKNLLGTALVVAGVVMLVVPGQGALTIAVGLLLVDFPGKRRLERWLATRKNVWRSLNWLRKKAGREPLERPEQEIGR
jgi:hypothetical protein